MVGDKQITYIYIYSRYMYIYDDFIWFTVDRFVYVSLFLFVETIECTRDPV